MHGPKTSQSAPRGAFFFTLIASDARLRQVNKPLTIRKPSLREMVDGLERVDDSRVALVRTATLVSHMNSAPRLTHSSPSLTVASIGFLASTTALAAAMVLMATL